MTNKEIQNSIIYQDESFLIANKPSTFASQKDTSKDASFQEILQQFASKSLFVVHRLDRPTSGAIVYAKKKRAAAYYNELSKNNLLKKNYIAAVKNRPSKDSGTLINFLRHDQQTRKSIVSDSNDKKAKKATLDYKVIDATDHYTILEIKLISGRFHQIRAQLAHIGSPIKGDVKYGARRANKDRSIHLHALGIEFPLQYNDEVIRIIAGLPVEPLWAAIAEKNPLFLQNKTEKWKAEK